MTAKHTPGPWKVGHGSWTEAGTAQYSLDGITELSAADARLISAAPDLLAIAERAYIKFGDFTADWPGRNTGAGQALLGDLRNAIAKATGREAEAVQDDYCIRVFRASQATGEPQA